jgi:hypothetical protein
MIQNVIPIIGNQLNEYLRNSFGEIEDRVVITSIGNNSGASSAETENKIIITLINVEEEKLIRNTGYNQLGGLINPSIYINLYVLFAANFPENNYREGLRFLSAVIYFFQGQHTFNPLNTPSLPIEVEKITVEIINVEFPVLSNIWSMLGGKYLPSIIYKFRMLQFNQLAMNEEIVPILLTPP